MINTNANYFIWKNINSLEKDIIITKMPTLPKFTKKVEKIDVPGRNGSLYYNEEAYETALLQIQCTLLENYNINDIKQWLDGESELILSIAPDKFYKAIIVNKIDFTSIANQLYTFPLEVEIQPIAYSIEEKEIILNKETEVIITKSTYKIKPYIKIVGNGNITFTINNKSIILNNIQDYLELDCELEEAYKENLNCNSSVLCDDFPTLIPGSNNISWIGNVSKIEIKYREAYL